MEQQSPQRNSGALSVTIRFLVTSLTKALLPQLLSLAGQPDLGSVLMVTNFFHLIMIEATVFLDLQCCRNVLVLFLRSMPKHNPVSELYGQFLRPHGLVFALTCTANCGTLYWQAYTFPNHVQSIEFTTGGLQLSCRNNSRIINGIQMHLSSIESHSKGSEYLGK
jgi:hypothetical protein